jgi:hypothetical protein
MWGAYIQQHIVAPTATRSGAEAVGATTCYKITKSQFSCAGFRRISDPRQLANAPSEPDLVAKRVQNRDQNTSTPPIL